VATGNPASSQLLALVAQHPSFGGLSERRVQLLADSALEMRFNPWDWIHRQGDSATPFAKVRGTVVTYPFEVSPENPKKSLAKCSAPRPSKKPDSSYNPFLMQLAMK
jgi:hypothetical protein